MLITETEVIRSHMRFPEGSRWHEGRLWFSDMHTGEVFALDPETGEAEVITKLAGQPSGLGWLANGDLIVSSMLDRQVLRVDADGNQTVHADLTAFSETPINDLVTDATGRAFLGAFGYDLYAEEPQRPGPIFRIEPTGETSVAAENFIFPNGMIIVPGTNTLVVAQTWGLELTGFDIAADGTLENRRTWAPLPEESTPDGICVDLEGGVWISDIVNSRFRRIVEGGEITDEVSVAGRFATDCVLGGPDGRTLFLLTADNWTPSVTAETWKGAIERVTVTVPGLTA